MTIAAGAKLGRYEVRSKIGAGGIRVRRQFRGQKFQCDLPIEFCHHAASDNVIARSSTFMYKGKEVDPQEAANKPRLGRYEIRAKGWRGLFSPHARKYQGGSKCHSQRQLC